MASFIHFSESFAAYLSQRRYECKIAEILHYNNGECDCVTDEQVNYLTFRNDGTISYLPAGKPHKVNEDTGDWLRDGRQNGKAAKVIRKLFTKECLLRFSDTDFEAFSNNYKSNFSEDGFELKLLDRSKIKDIYDMTIGEGEGCLSGSCMNGDSNYLDIYAACKDLSILALTKGGKLYGRALVWKINGDITLMDRIYVTKDFLFEKFLEYVKTNGYWRKKHYKTYDDKIIFIKPDGSQVDKNFTIYTDVNFSQFPYIDTFQYGNDESLNNYGDGYYQYDNTNGDRSGGNNEDEHENEVYDEHREEYICDDEAIYLEHGSRNYRNTYAHIDDTICTEDGNRYHEDDENGNYVEINGCYYDLDSDDIICIDNEYVLIEDCVFVERDGEYKLQEDCVEDIDGEWILKSEAVKDEHGDWIHEDDYVEPEVKDDDATELPERPLYWLTDNVENPNQLDLFTDKNEAA